MTKKIQYAVEPGLNVEEFLDVLRRSGLAERRPVADHDRIARMLKGADLIITARVEGMIVGIARSLTDFSYCCYLSDLAVAESHKSLGIGKALIEETRRQAGPDSMCLLLAAPDAESFYDHIGMPRISNAFMHARQT